VASLIFLGPHTHRDGIAQRCRKFEGTPGFATAIVCLGAHVPSTCFQYLVAIRLSLTLSLKRHSHGGGATCEQCHRQNVDRRAAREAHEAITVHYSTITSGSQVIKYNVTRETEF
jgi:hypothetical protein